MTTPSLPISAPVQDHSSRTGLSDSEASQRLLADGPNSLPVQERHGLLAIAWVVVKEPMFLLLVAAGVLYLLMGEPGDAVTNGHKAR